MKVNDEVAIHIYETGDPSFTRTRIARIMYNHQNNVKTANEHTMSTNRFTYFHKIPVYVAS